jgi:hypothetical protein
MSGFRLIIEAPNQENYQLDKIGDGLCHLNKNLIKNMQRNDGMLSCKNQKIRKRNIQLFD